MELYVHIPFCVKKCDYCDFLSFPCDGEGQDIYCDALTEEIGSVGKLLRGKAEKVTSVFVGGGTPSVLVPRYLERVWGALADVFSLTEDCEITIETNPGTLTADKVKLYRQLGINRISLGCQSTHDEELKTLGRIHTYREFLESYDLVRKEGFTNVNVDLMSAIPGQSMEAWKDNLEKIAVLEPEHISAYSLIVEEGTPYYERKLDLPDEEAERMMYEVTGEILGKSGYVQYEISNYCRRGYACRHNVGYWRRVPYLGLGLGASSFYEGKRFSNTRDMGYYVKNANNLSVIRENVEMLTRRDAMEEFMFLGLRMTEGISMADFKENFGQDIYMVYGKQIRKLIALELLAEDGDHLWLTRRGISLSNQVFVEFLF